MASLASIEVCNLFLQTVLKCNVVTRLSVLNKKHFLFLLYVQLTIPNACIIFMKHKWDKVEICHMDKLVIAKNKKGIKMYLYELLNERICYKLRC